MKTLAIIPARGGSKGLPRKNILPLGGKPLIVHSIIAAKACTLIDRTIVSTDDLEIARVARDHGAEVPFIRPPDLSNDTASGTAVVLHAVEHLAVAENYRPDLILLLQPTSPFRSVADIEHSIQLCIRSGLPVVGIKHATEFPQWMKDMDAEGRIQALFPALQTPDSRQQLPAAYLVNGAIYLSPRETLLKNRSFYEPKPLGYVMPESRSLDIDTIEDFRYAEFMLA